MRSIGLPRDLLDLLEDLFKKYRILQQDLGITLL